MLQRRKYISIKEALARQAAVALIGPRQVGKTTLAHTLADEITTQKKSIYLDLESRRDRDKLVDPELFLERYEDHLVILDEIHRFPELFQILRGLIDKGRRHSKGIGRFLILGSAALDLLKQSGETLAGRIEYINLAPFDALEVGSQSELITQLWIRGGFPDSYLAGNDHDSFVFRRNFIRTYLERDVPQFGPRIPAETLERLWMMLAHSQGTLLNASKIAAGLSVTAPTVTSYIDLLVDLLLVRRLPPFHANIGKRLVKSPKVYVRDSGLVHALLGLESYEDLSGHPIVGASWEGFVVENLLAALPERASASFYRTAAGAEVDLLISFPKGELWAIEIKRGLAARLEKGFYNALDDLKPVRSFVVYSGEERYPVSRDVEAISLYELASLLARL